LEVLGLRYEMRLVTSVVEREESLRLIGSALEKYCTKVVERVNV
jgi:hypothetical protein